MFLNYAKRAVNKIESFLHARSSNKYMNLTLRTPEEAMTYLWEQYNKLDDILSWDKYTTGRKPQWILDNCKHVLTIPHFKVWFASSPSEHQHHYYTGGLAVHTAEVLEGAQQLINNPRVIIPAVIFHDVAKVHDYDRFGNKMPYHYRIRHIAGSYALWFKLTNEIWSSEYELFEHIGHCILSHHGKKEWGSPVEPQTEEAQAIHRADYFSATEGPGKKLKQIEPNREAIASKK